MGEMPLGLPFGHQLRHAGSSSGHLCGLMGIFFDHQLVGLLGFGIPQLFVANTDEELGLGGQDFVLGLLNDLLEEADGLCQIALLSLHGQSHLKEFLIILLGIHGTDQQKGESDGNKSNFSHLTNLPGLALNVLPQEESCVMAKYDYCNFYAMLCPRNF